MSAFQKSVEDVDLRIVRLTKSIVTLEIAARFKEIAHQLSDCSHVTPEEMLSFLRQAHTLGIWILGSFEDGLLVSTLSLYFDLHPWGIELRVNNVVTDGEYRGRGHCERLLAEARAMLPGIHPIGRKKRGVYKGTLAVSNPVARKIYEDFGFKKDSEEELRWNIDETTYVSPWPRVLVS